MKDSKSLPFHSGVLLQRLREFQGLSVSELSQDLDLSLNELMCWEAEGVPEDRLEQCSLVFDIPMSFFHHSLHSKKDLDRLVTEYLFPQKNETPHVCIELNIKTKSDTLDLSGLNLIEIPEKVFQLKWIRILKLNDNQLKTIPYQMALLDNLETIEVENNLINKLPASFSIFDEKVQIYLDKNPIIKTNLVSKQGAVGEYLNDIYETNRCLLIIESFSQSTLKAVDDIVKIIPNELPLVFEHSNLLDLDKINKNISCVIYLSEKNNPEIILSCGQALQEKEILAPIIIYNPYASEKESLESINKKLIKLLPSMFYHKTITTKEALKVEYLDIIERLKIEADSPKVVLKRLTLENIGVYDNLTINLNSDLTVLIGVNGSGKTTILKSLALAVLGPKLAKIDSNSAADLLKIVGKHAKQTQWRASGKITLQAIVDKIIHENIICISYDSNTEQVEVFGDKFKELFNTEGHLANLIIGIGEQRQSAPGRSHETGLEISQPKPKDLLPIINFEEQSFLSKYSSWLGNLAFMMEKNSNNYKHEIDMSFAVFSALMKESIRFGGLTKIDPLELWVELDDTKQIIPLKLISQGYQAVLGWVGFLIQRMYQAYADRVQPMRQAAIIIIDEIDQLLHVKWQKDILNILTKQFFPNTQWIVTTHSPVVVAGLDKGQVVQLHQKGDKFVAEPNPVDLWVWQYGDVMRNLFEISPVSTFEHEKDIKKLIIDQKKLPIKQQTNLEELEIKLERLQKSRAFVDDLYKEQLKLRAREKELTELINKLGKGI